MQANIVIILYCLLALLNYGGSWFINDLSYGLRLIVLALPLYFQFDKLKIVQKYIFALLLFTNIITILSDYKHIDKFDDIIYYPKLIFIIILLLISISDAYNKLKKNK